MTFTFVIVVYFVCCFVGNRLKNAYPRYNGDYEVASFWDYARINVCMYTSQNPVDKHWPLLATNVS